MAAPTPANLHRQLARVSRRLFVQSLLDSLIWCWAGALILAAGWSLAEPHAFANAPSWLRWSVAGGLVGMATFLAIVIAVWRRPSVVDTALSLDNRFGLKERVTTSVGLSEAEAKQRDPEVRVDRFPWTAIGKAVAIGETEGFTKVIRGKYGEILGAHIIGPDATNLISEYSVAMRGELTVDEIIETIHPHPTLSEGLREAILAVEGRPIHIPPKQAVRAR